MVLQVDAPVVAAHRLEAHAVQPLTVLATVLLITAVPK